MKLTTVDLNDISTALDQQVIAQTGAFNTATDPVAISSIGAIIARLSCLRDRFLQENNELTNPVDPVGDFDFELPHPLVA